MSTVVFSVGSNPDTSGAVFRRNRVKAPPCVKWAQRQELVFITICIANPKVDLVMIDGEEGRNLFFRGKDASSRIYQLDLDLFDNVNNRFQFVICERGIELVLQKKESHWWCQLAADSVKTPTCIEPDFAKWVDEGEQNCRRLLEEYLGFTQREDSGREELELVFERQSDRTKWLEFTDDRLLQYHLE